MSDKLKMEGILSKGYGLIPKLIMQDQDISIEAKSIYAYFASYAGNGTTAFPSVSKTIYDLKIGEERYYKHRKQLIDKGYLTITQQKAGNGKFNRNIYTLPPYPEIPSTENTTTEKPSTGNLGTNNNNINNNISNSNNINNLDDDENIINDLRIFITPKIIMRLKESGIHNVTVTKLTPLARSMAKFIHVYKQDHKEVEEIILLAIELFELNNGKSIKYIIKILKDWEDHNLYTVKDIREYNDNYENKEAKGKDIEPVPMINWLMDLNE